MGSFQSLGQFGAAMALLSIGPVYGQPFSSKHRKARMLRFVFRNPHVKAHRAIIRAELAKNPKMARVRG